MFFKKTYDKIVKELYTKKLRLTIADEQTFKKHVANGEITIKSCSNISLLVQTC